MNVSREPILKAATVVSIVAALLGVLVAFGVDVTDDQRAAIMEVVVILSPFLVAGATWLFSRRYTTTTDSPRAENEYGEIVDLKPVDGSRLKVK